MTGGEEILHYHDLSHEFFQRIFDAWDEHPGKIIGTSLGFLIGILILLIGFFETLLLLICSFAGLWLGRKYDSGENDFFQRLEEMKLPNRLKFK